MDITTVYLKEIDGRLAFFPDATNSSFTFTRDVGTVITSLYVEGGEAHGSHSGAVVSAMPPATPRPSGVNHLCRGSGFQRPTFRTVPKKTTSTVASLNLKILQAEVRKSPNGKPELNKVSQMFTQVTGEINKTIIYTQCMPRNCNAFGCHVVIIDFC